MWNGLGLLRLIQLDHVAERVMEERLVTGARDEREPVHLDTLLLYVGDCRVKVVDSDREVVCSWRLRVGLHQMDLLAAGIEPEPRAEVRARQLRHSEHVAIEGQTLLCISDTDSD